ncbi:substrate-binding periplasmic protein [Aliikangiella sp. IMCC44359]|uniref:substrate-binding periplasmic protein n=1 Tax=Aliikangiella sp. IMCC44359 TaxID=3459125 RepID=UPI00403A81FC
MVLKIFNKWSIVLLIGIILLLLQYTSSDSNQAKEQLVNIPSQQCTLKLGWTDWPPYLEPGKEGPKGFQIEFVQWITKEMGCDVTYHKRTWEENLKAIENGDIDFLGRASKFSEREMYAHFSEPYRDDMLALMVRENNKHNYTAESLIELLDKGFIIGVLRGGYFGEEVEAIRQNPKYAKNFIQYSLENDILIALDEKLIDGIFEAPFTIDSAKRQTVFKHQFEKLPIKILIGQLHFMFSKKTTSEEMVKNFNLAMATVKRSKAYKEHWFWTMIL